MSELAETQAALTAAQKRIAEQAKEIQQLKAQVEQIDRERIEYLQNVSHQLVAPLNAMKWHIENISSARVGIERARKVLRSVYSQATIAVHLAKNFALMSNLEADHQLTALQEGLEEVDLGRLAINLADDFQPLGWDRGLKLEVDQSSFFQVPPVLAIKPLISQVFGNLIENSIKYSNDNTQIIIKGSYQRSADAVTVTITNEGIPIPPEEYGAIFDRGFRSDRARSQYPAGTGFGLYIAKKVIELHQGSIGVSTDTRGRTVFSVTLSVSKLKERTWTRKPFSS
jgi:signal transduction histidine kinase